VLDVPEGTGEAEPGGGVEGDGRGVVLFFDGNGLGDDTAFGVVLGLGFDAGGEEVAARTRPELGSAMSEDSSIASHADAGMVFSSSSMSVDHPFSAVPWKYQSEPLSATIIP